MTISIWPGPEAGAGGSPRRWNVLVYAGVLWANALAGAGAISGESIGLIANRYPSHFLPAGYVFSIWGLIYLGLGLFVLYQSLPTGRENETLGRIGFGWVVNGALNVGWVVAFSFSLFGTALAIMIGLLLNLAWMDSRVGFGARARGWGDRLFVTYPFALYFAWISVAVVANAFQLFTYLGLEGVMGPLPAAFMMVMVTGLAVTRFIRRGDWIFPLVVAWALVGIAQRYPEVPLLANAAYAMAGLGLGAVAVGLMLRSLRPGYRDPSTPEGAVAA